MGQELACQLTYKRRKLSGKAYLETDYLLFRGEERLKIPIADLTGVKASGGVLRLEFDGGPAAFELGPAAEKWERKILHPPSRLEKLGVKPGIMIETAGTIDAEFRKEIAGQTAPPGAKPDLLFSGADSSEDLAQIATLASRVKPGGGLWVIYPKGVSAIREIEVIAAGRAAGLKDNKVARFSATHTALRFALPRN